MSRVRSIAPAIEGTVPLTEFSSVNAVRDDRWSCCMSTTTMRAIRLTEWQSDPVLTEVPVPEPQRCGGARRGGRGGAVPHGPPPHEQPAGRRIHTRFRSRSVTRSPAGSPRSVPMRRASPKAIRSSSTAGGGAASAGNAGTGATTRARARRSDRTARGLGRDGGLAEYVIVPSARYLVPAQGLDPVSAAPLTDAALTPYHAVKLSLPQLHADTTAVVLGVGGLGHMGVQVLKAVMRCPDRRRRLARARRSSWPRRPALTRCCRRTA